MNKQGTLSQQVEAYHGWKKELIRQIGRYRLWLQDNNLFSDDVSNRIRHGLELLIEDELTIAFVGEYSRGKTELINALFFSEYGQRMLPSQAGRTTMCPTELFFDRTSNSNYLLLLPIETRTGELSLQQLRKQPERWVKHDLDERDPEIMREVLAEVARVKSVTPQEARKLGFDEDMLEHDRNKPGNVVVPAWRNAQISIRHPLFERGLRILDTPGLNALGSEPELTISMLPRAHAIIFLLSADTGVTASDMTIWKDHIDTEHADHRAGRFAVLNKIDVLWDDLQGEMLKGLVSEDRFESHAEKVRQKMSKSWTTAGMNHSMDHFFELLENDLSNLLSEGRLAEKMVGAIYRRYNEDTRARHLEPIPLRAGRHVIAIRELRKKAKRFRISPKNLLTEQSLLVRRFFNVMVGEARTLHLRVRADVERWPSEALLPIMQYSMEQKQLLEHQIRRLRDMVRSDRDSRAERARLQNTISDLTRQLELADAMQRQIRKPAPTLIQQKVVNISGAV